LNFALVWSPSVRAWNSAQLSPMQLLLRVQVSQHRSNSLFFCLTER
jgi:hypothetical protein